MRYMARLALVFVFMGSQPVFAPWMTPHSAAAETVESLLKKVEAKYKDVKSIQASVVQTTKSELYGSATTKGKLSLQRPSQMRWDFDDGKKFVSDGSTMWIWSPDTKQVIRYKDFSDQSAGAESLLQSLGTLSEQFDVKIVSQSAESYELALSPKGQDASKSQFKKMTLQLSSSFVISKLDLLDNFDTTTGLAFTDVRLGQAIPADHFQFTVPDGATVVDAGG